MCCLQLCKGDLQRLEGIEVQSDLGFCKSQIIGKFSNVAIRPQPSNLLTLSVWMCDHQTYYQVQLQYINSTNICQKILHIQCPICPICAILCDVNSYYPKHKKKLQKLIFEEDKLEKTMYFFFGVLFLEIQLTLEIKTNHFNFFIQS